MTSNLPSLLIEWQVSRVIADAISCKTCHIELIGHHEVAVRLCCDPLSVEPLNAPGWAFDSVPRAEALVRFASIPADRTFGSPLAFEPESGFVSESKFCSSSLYFLRSISDSFWLNVIVEKKVILGIGDGAYPDDAGDSLNNGWAFGLRVGTAILPQHLALMVRGCAIEKRFSASMTIQDAPVTGFFPIWNAESDD